MICERVAYLPVTRRGYGVDLHFIKYITPSPKEGVTSLYTHVNVTTLSHVNDTRKPRNVLGDKKLLNFFVLYFTFNV